MTDLERAAKTYAAAVEASHEARKRYEELRDAAEAAETASGRANALAIEAERALLAAAEGSSVMRPYLSDSPPQSLEEADEQIQRLLGAHTRSLAALAEL